MEINPRHVHELVKSSEVPKHLPKVEYKGNPVEYKLPYTVKVNAEKLALFMKGVGIPEDKIQKAKLKISYNPAQALGVVYPWAPNAVIFAGEIQRGVLASHSELLKDLHGEKSFGDAMKKLNTRVSRFIAKQMFYELNEKGMSDSLPRLDQEARSELTTIAKQESIDSDQMKRAVEQNIQNLVDAQLRLVVPHELVHVRQQATGEMLKKLAVVLPLSFLTRHFIDKAFSLAFKGTEKIEQRYGKKTGRATEAIVLGAKIYTGWKETYYARKLLGFETAAYKEMKYYDELFKDIVEIVPTEVTIDQALEASKLGKNKRKDKKFAKSFPQVKIGQYDAQKQKT